MIQSLMVAFAVVAQGVAPGATPAAPAATAPAATPPAAAVAVVADPLSFAVEKFQLDNGLEVLLHHDPRQPFVTVNVTYHVGARDEEVGKTGFAHLFEHLMFQGSQHVPGDSHFKMLEQAGAEPINGTTDFDYTNYYETVPRHQLDLALWLEADRMGYLLEGSNVEKLNEQRAVVKNERRQSLEGQAYGVATEKLWQAMLPKAHPYYGIVIGSMDDLDRASFDDVRRFYDAYYAPSNATLAVVGDYDPATVKDIIKKYFASLPKWPAPPRKPIPAVSLTQEVKVEHEELVGKEMHVELVWLTPAMMKPGNIDLDVLANVLGDGIGSRLQSALMVQAQQATHVGVSQQSYGELSLFTIDVNLKKGVTAQDVLNTLQAQLDFLVDAPVTPAEVERAKSKLETALVFEQEVGYARAATVQHWNHFAGDPTYLSKLLTELRAVTPDSVMAAYKQHLPKDKRAQLIATPKTAPAATPAAAAATPAPPVPPATAAPAATPAPTAAAPTVTK